MEDGIKNNLKLGAFYKLNSDKLTLYRVIGLQHKKATVLKYSLKKRLFKGYQSIIAKLSIKYKNLNNVKELTILEADTYKADILNVNSFKYFK